MKKTGTRTPCGFHDPYRVLGEGLDTACGFLTNDPPFCCRSVIEAFAEHDDVTSLMFSGDALKATEHFEDFVGKGKGIVFVKKIAHALDKVTFEDQLFMFELSPDFLTHIEKTLDRVFIPLFTNPYCQEGWGDIISKEVTERLHNFISNVSIVVGQSQGKTFLPCPPVDVISGHDSKNSISLLEGAVITWTKQIKNVLKLDPETLLKEGLHPTPDMEITFWKTKADHLNSIFEQLQSDKIRRVLRAGGQRQHQVLAHT
jgi:dynein heavy chain